MVVVAKSWCCRSDFSVGYGHCRAGRGGGDRDSRRVAHGNAYTAPHRYTNADPNAHVRRIAYTHVDAASYLHPQNLAYPDVYLQSASHLDLYASTGHCTGTAVPLVIWRTRQSRHLCMERESGH